ncbi:MAG TPA: L,D-transpeptidase [Phycisphaerae bacterium]|nr:L,D-transpeptidase [Phycisphaerae bacterium]HNU47077.1 L,D-transpeptidase [Phycisphaerae bacterium]
MAGVLALLAVGLLGGWVARAPGRPPAALTLNAPRVVVLKQQRVLHLFDGERLIRTYPVDLGTAPTGQKQRANDGRTPVGRFRVVRKNPDSPYHRFLGIDYPDAAAAQRGLQAGLISAGEAARLREAHDGGVCPDWTTVLGGGIGIHGHRRGWDWTAGCVALADEHVEELYSVLRLGDPIDILP